MSYWKGNVYSTCTSTTMFRHVEQPQREWNNPTRRFIFSRMVPRHTSIQQNNSSRLATLQEMGIIHKLLLYTQPTNLPDSNINNLVFCALQWMNHCECPIDEAEIIQYVSKTYNEYDYIKIDFIWLTLMGCYNEIIDCHGDNDYIPHIGKAALQRQGQRPTSLLGVQQVTRKALNYLEIFLFLETVLFYT